MAQISDGGAEFSKNRKYRYALWRIWDNSKAKVMFIGLNPSVADETSNDRTLDKCIKFTKDWDYGGVYMLNLFAFVSTNPAMLIETRDPVGVDNNLWLKKSYSKVDKVIAAWGNRGALNCRNLEVFNMLGKMYCLGLTIQGHPRHPLYVRRGTPLDKYVICT